MALTDFVEGTPLAGLGGGLSGIIDIAGTLVVFVLIATIILLGAWLFAKRKKYNMPTPIFSKRSGTWKYINDKAMYSKDKATGLWDFRFKKLKEVVAPPPYKVLLPGEGGTNVAVYAQNSAGELYPCDIEVIFPKEYEEEEVEVLNEDGTTSIMKQKIAKCKLKIIEPDIALWSTQQDMKLMETYGNKNWWDKYGNYVMFFGTALLVIVLLFLVLKKIDVVQEAARLFKESAQILKTSGVQVPSSAP